MRKTTLYLPDELKRDLERVAAETGRTEADVIRDGIRLVIAGRDPPPPRAGIFESGSSDLSERVDELLEGFGRS